MALAQVVQDHVDSVLAFVAAEFAARSDSAYFKQDRPGIKLMDEVGESVKRGFAAEDLSDLGAA